MPTWYISITARTDTYLLENDKINYILIEGRNHMQNYTLHRHVYSLGWFDKMRGLTLVDKIINAVNEMRNNIKRIDADDAKINIEFKIFEDAVADAKSKLGDDLYI